MTEAQRRQLSNSKKGRPALNKGITYSQEVRKRMSEGRIGKGRAEKHWNWKGGITEKNHAIRTSTAYKEWRSAVLARDDYRCYDCGQRGGNLEVDHIYPFALFPRLRFVLENGRTLCEECHSCTDTFGHKCYTKFKSLNVPAAVQSA